MIVLSPYPKLQFIDNNGVPMAGCLLFTYAAGTDSPLATYTDQSGTAYNSNPIILDAGGRASVWLDSNLSYKYKLLNADGTILFTVDNINGSQVNTQILTINTIADLVAIDTTQLQSATYTVLGYNVANDGGGGTFYFVSNSTLTADGGMIIEPTDGIGRWFRVVEGTEVNIRWYGATGNGSEDATPMLQAANDYAASQSPNWSVYLPAGVYTLNTNPTLTVPIHMAVGAQLNWGNFVLSIDPIFDTNDFTQHFITTGGGVDLTGDVIDVYPEWFGAVGDGSMTSDTPTTDDTAAIQAAIDSCSPGQRVILNCSKKYWSGQLILKPGISVCGSLSDQHYPHPAGNDFVSNLAFLSSGTSFLNLTNSDVGDLRGVTVRDLILDGINKNAAMGIFLQTSGSLIENCTIRNCVTGIILNGNLLNSNRVINNAFVDCTQGVAGGPGSGNIVMGNSFVSCTTDTYMTDSTGWTIAENSLSSSPVPGAVAHLFGVTDYKLALLPGIADSAIELGKIGGLATVSSMASGLVGLGGLAGLTDDANFWNRKYIVTAADMKTRLHDSLGGDIISVTPRVDTRAWYERDLDGGHHWGDKDQEYMSLSGAGVLSFPSNSQIARFRISNQYFSASASTESVYTNQGRFVNLSIDGISGVYDPSTFPALKLVIDGSLCEQTSGAGNISITAVGSTGTITVPSGLSFIAGQILTIMRNEVTSPFGDLTSESYQMQVSVNSYSGTSLAFTVISQIGLGAVLTGPMVLIQLPFVPKNQATLYPCILRVLVSGNDLQVPGYARITNSQIIFYIAKQTNTGCYSGAIPDPTPWLTYDQVGWYKAGVFTGTKGFYGFNATIAIV